MSIRSADLGVGRRCVWEKEEGSRRTGATESGHTSGGLEDPKHATACA